MSVCIYKTKRTSRLFCLVSIATVFNTIYSLKLTRILPTSPWQVSVRSRKWYLIKFRRHWSVTAECGEAGGNRKRQARCSGQTRDQDGRNTMQQPGPYYETRYEIAAVIAKRISSMEPLLLCSLLLCYWPADCPLQETVQESPELLLEGFSQRRHPYKRFRAGVLTLFLQSTALVTETHRWYRYFSDLKPIPNYSELLRMNCI